MSHCYYNQIVIILSIIFVYNDLIYFSIDKCYNEKNPKKDLRTNMDIDKYLNNFIEKKKLQL